MINDLCNVAAELIAPNLSVRPNGTAFIDDHGACSYRDLDAQVSAFAGWLHSIGLAMETRILIVMEDCLNYPIVCLGAIRAGLVPVMVNPLLTSDDLAYILDDSRARLLIASQNAWPRLQPVLAARPFLERVLVDGEDAPGEAEPLAVATGWAEPLHRPALTRRDDVCLWQYSSGSTGRPKGTMHTHGAVMALRDLYPRQILDLRDTDVTFSAAKLFFGYGFGNGMVFPLLAGATAVLMAERPTAPAVWKRLVEARATIFYGVPTLYKSLLADPAAPTRDALALRRCTSAGEALPAEIGQLWRERYAVDILDGIGSTEMLHIFLTNQPGDVRYGTTGRPVAGYEVRLLDETGVPVPVGEIGELHVRGPTSAAGYWNNREKTQATFLGNWVKTGDKFRQDEDGRYVFCGRGDDMLKVSGIYVSPLEVEEALCAHPAILEAAVIGWPDEMGLIKPKAFVVLKTLSLPTAPLADEFKSHVKTLLSPYKYPRWFEFVSELPKTATGKIERYKLRRDS